MYYPIFKSFLSKLWYEVDPYREFWDVIKGENILFSAGARKLKGAQNYLF